MAVQDNRPQVTQVIKRLAALPAALLTPFEVKEGDVTIYPQIEEMLDDSVAWVEDQATTSFNCRYLPVTQEGVALEPTPQGTQGEGKEILERGFKLPAGQGFVPGEEVGYEAFDGNTTNQIVTRKRPIAHIAALQVVTPILGYTRVYTAEEIKNYVKEGVVKVWTYKLAVEQALLQTIDYQAWGSLFPPLPQAVQLAYAYGYPLFDPECESLKNAEGKALPTGPGTSYDGGRTWHVGDIRDPEQVNWLRNLQQAAVCNTAAEFLGQSVGLARGLVSSVSFDGYSRGIATNPFQSEIESLITRRDELMGRRKRRYVMGTIG
jgi:hypothetical protein